MNKRIWVAVLAAGLVGGGIWAYEKLQDGFYESAIHLNTWPEKQYGTLSCEFSALQIREVLKQPFSYLGKGRQFYAFESADGKYVLKFLKSQRIDVSNVYKGMWLPKFLDEERQKKLAFRQQRVKGIFESCLIAATFAPRITGVVYCHLHRKSDVKCVVELKDKLGLSHNIFLDCVPFVVQKKAKRLYPTLQKLLDEKNYDRLRKHLNSLINLIDVEALIGIHDTDSGMFARDNVGFIDYDEVRVVEFRDQTDLIDFQPLQVDIGTLVHKESAYSYEHLKEQLLRLDPVVEWLEAKDPQQAAYFKDKIAKKLIRLQHLEGGSLSESTPKHPA